MALTSEDALSSGDLSGSIAPLLTVVLRPYGHALGTACYGWNDPRPWRPSTLLSLWRIVDRWSMQLRVHTLLSQVSCSETSTPPGRFTVSMSSSSLQAVRFPPSLSLRRRPDRGNPENRSVSRSHAWAGGSGCSRRGLPHPQALPRTDAFLAGGVAARAL